MKDSVWINKIKSKYKWNPVVLVYGLKDRLSFNILGGKNRTEHSRKELTEDQHKKSKGCGCGGHSISAHKQKWKYPQWKKKSRRQQE